MGTQFAVAQFGLIQIQWDRKNDVRVYLNHLTYRHETLKRNVRVLNKQVLMP
jgi:hypothetical protein